MDPTLLARFEDAAHPEVIIAMRQTIASMLGTLPAEYFQVMIRTEAQNLAQVGPPVVLPSQLLLLSHAAAARLSPSLGSRGGGTLRGTT